MFLLNPLKKERKKNKKKNFLGPCVLPPKAFVEMVGRVSSSGAAAAACLVQMEENLFVV